MNSKIKNSRGVVAHFKRCIEAEIDGTKLKTELWLRQALKHFNIDCSTWNRTQIMNCFISIIRKAYQKRSDEMVEILKSKGRRNKDKTLIIDALLVKPVLAKALF